MTQVSVAEVVRALRARYLPVRRGDKTMILGEFKEVLRLPARGRTRRTIRRTWQRLVLRHHAGSAHGNPWPGNAGCRAVARFLSFPPLEVRSCPS